MNKLQLKGNWNQVKGAIKEKWAELTDDDMLAIEADNDKLIGKIQERYGIRRELAEKQVEEYLNANGCC
ncbi:MAG TPA: CsbD family protein [Candidatus Melainabacteria bacterium]|nr:CsbD family protein [Candidatus Melainabacteria bacterium]